VEKKPGFEFVVNRKVNNKSSISLNLSLELYPLVMCLDKAGRILFCSERMEIFFKENYLGSSIFDLFNVEGSVAQIMAKRSLDGIKQNCLFLLSNINLRIALRGQIIDGMYDSKHAFIFVGAPWTSWYFDNFDEHEFDARDFPTHDSQLEYQLNLCSTKEMLSDLKLYSEKLKQSQILAESANLAKTKFVRHISHELRTPLHGVITSLKILQDKNSKDKQARLFEIANSSAHALMELINEVLDFSSIESGSLPSALETFDLHSTLKKIEVSLQAIAAEKNQHLQFDICPSLPAQIIADKNALRKILYNLVGNAVKYSESDIIISRFRLRTANGKKFLAAEVEDFGVGIKEENLKQIFDPFWVSEDIPSNEFRTGLGLSIVKEMIEKLGGSVEVSSVFGQGTHFSFSLPFSKPKEEVVYLKDRPATPPVNTRFEGNVLAVDDNRINLELAQIMLSNLGLSITTAINGSEAIIAEKEEDFDLILMDIKMPVLNGVQATKKIREKGRNRAIPIIAMTANVSKEDIKHYLSNEMTSTITKPVVAEELVQLLARYLPYSEIKINPSKSSADKALGDGHSLLDISEFKKLVIDIGLENVNRIVALYIAEASEQMTELILQLNSGEMEKSEKIAHRAASSTLAFGLNRLGYRLRDIEKSTKNGTKIELDEIKVLGTMFDESKKALLAACDA
jgi:signal transduction histidine kinase/CheY-like chemotaxis protein/HPt (histidine-containing phosphotransfer) domain-containing protein